MAGMVYALPWLAYPRVVLAIGVSEIILAVWLLAGAVAEAAWCASVVFFSGASVTAAYMWWVGVSHCPCFGAWQIAPGRVIWLDLVLVGLLWVIRPTKDSIAAILWNALSGWPGRLMLVFWCMPGLLAVWATVTSGNSGQSTAGSQKLTLLPEVSSLGTEP
ncbi:MAG: hypothetical protein KatS3mg110_1446 [Pirellulaceae bacterium]|nr:MAG: hypothetical protein KatS3mg110_1446 [Pirellulaceae bacterium]